MLKFYFEGQSMIFKLHGKFHERIVLFRQNYIKHIKTAHPEMNMRKIVEILEEPDYVYKTSHGSKDYYYEKRIGKCKYRVVITEYKRHVKSVVTAYKLIYNNEFDKKHIYCVYDKNNFRPLSQCKAKSEDDLDYFID